MNLGLELIIGSLGMELGTMIFLAFTILSILFFALDFKVGLILETIVQAILFMWFKNATYINSWRLPLISFMITIVLLSLSLYFVNKTSTF